MQCIYATDVYTYGRVFLVVVCVRQSQIAKAQKFSLELCAFHSCQKWKMSQQHFTWVFIIEVFNLCRLNESNLVISLCSSQMSDDDANLEIVWSSVWIFIYFFCCWLLCGECMEMCVFFPIILEWAIRNLQFDSSGTEWLVHSFESDVSRNSKCTKVNMHVDIVRLCLLDLSILESFIRNW